MCDRTYIVNRREGVSPEIRWFLRGIREDGSFYGELLCRWEAPRVIDGTCFHGKGRTIVGMLSPTDCRRFKELAAGIGSPGAAPIDGWTGRLAEGRVSKPVVRYYYVPGAEKTSGEASKFLAAIELLAGYVRPYYAELT
jgi:hypothetical protein